MDLIERSCHPTPDQVDYLIEFLNENRDMAKGFKRAQARELKRRWMQLAEQLNNMGTTIKTWQQWAKYWSDKRNSVKKKVAARAVTRHRTGGGYESGGRDVPDLSEVDMKVITIMGGEEFALGDAHQLNNSFETDSSEHNLPEHLGNIESLFTPSLTILPGNISPLQGSELGTSTPDDVTQPQQSQQTPPELDKPTPVDAIRAGSNWRGTLRVRQSLQQTYDPPRRRARRVGAARPVQSHLTTITKRFLRLQEARVNIEKGSLELLRKYAEDTARRDHLVAQGLAAIGEGLKLLAQTLNK